MMATLNELLRPTNDLAMALMNMQTSELMCDINLVAEDNLVVKAHKLVLVAMSPFFHNMYLNGNDFTTFQFKNANVETVTKLVQFLYGNVFAINAQNARDIYPFATLLELTHVTKLCEYFDPGVKDIPYDFSETFIMPIVEGRQQPAAESEFVTPKQKRQSEPFSTKRKRLEKTLSLLSKPNKRMKRSTSEDDEEWKSPTVARNRNTRKIETKKSEDDVMYQCDVCSLMCATLKSMESHVLSHHELAEEASGSNPSSPEEILDDPLPGFSFKFSVADLAKEVKERSEEFNLWSELKVIKPKSPEKKVERERKHSEPGESGGLRKKEVEVTEETMPEGWRKIFKQRMIGKESGRIDAVLISPAGRRFKSRKDILDYYDKINEPVDIDNLSFSKIGHEKYLAVNFSKMARGSSLSTSNLFRPAQHKVSSQRRSASQSSLSTLKTSKPTTVRNFLKSPFRIALKGSFSALKGKSKGKSAPSLKPKFRHSVPEHQLTTSTIKKPASPSKLHPGFSQLKANATVVLKSIDKDFGVRMTPPTENGTTTTSSVVLLSKSREKDVENCAPQPDVHSSSEMIPDTPVTTNATKVDDLQQKSDGKDTEPDGKANGCNSAT